MKVPSTLKSLDNSFPNTKKNKNEISDIRSMISLVQKTKVTVQKSRNSFEIGTCVEAKGCIQEFQGRPQILAFSIREVQDPNQEMKRYIRLSQLKKDIYPKDFFS